MKVREHGTRAKYVIEKCRCEPCTIANREYSRSRDRATRRPDEVARSPFIAAGAVRHHLLELSAAGVGYKAVAIAAGVSKTSLANVLNGTAARIARSTASKVLAVTPAAVADGALVDGARTWELVERLLAAGWTKAAISRAIGQHGRALQLGRDRVTARNARLVADLAASLPPTETAAEYRARAQASTDEFEELYQTLADIIEERSEPWRGMAACSAPSITVDLFYVQRGDQATEAHGVCSRCTVVEECLSAGLREREGLWGDLPARARRRLRSEAVA